MPPIAAVPLPPARSLPVGSCDAHAHVFGPFDVYPLARDTEGAYPLATRELHLAMLDRVGCTYGVLVHASQNGLDCSNMLDALDQAPERLRGIAVVEPATAAETLADMARRGVRGVRVTEMRLPDGSALPYAQDFATIAPLAATMRELGWHAELWAPCATIVARVPELLAHGIPLAIDHMAMVDVDRGARDGAFRALLALLAEEENLWVKVPPQRVSARFPDYEDVRPFFEELVATRPDRLVWGSDYPHVHQAQQTPNVGHVLDLIAEWCGEETVLRSLLVENPRRLYGF
jgi:predicted TIM-barrel fold metal-dependent hydrolase